MQPITVTGERPSNSQSINVLSELPLNQTPLTVSIIESTTIKNYGFNSLSNLLRLEPAAGDAYNTLGYIESLNVRGFLLDNRFNYRRDGLPVSNHMPVVIENKERLELLKGTAGILAGISSPGGLLNAVVKRPLSKDLTEASIQLSEKGSIQLTGDLSRRSVDGQWGFRVNFSALERRPFAESASGQHKLASAIFQRQLNGHLLEAEIETARSKQISVPGLGLLDSDGDGYAETLPPQCDRGSISTTRVGRCRLKVKAP